MKILIIGFNSTKEIDDAVAAFINKTGTYLFYVLCGQVRGLAEEWAEKRGLPIWRVKADQPSRVATAADYVIAKVNDGTPQWIKNLVILCPHGMIVR